MRTTLRLIVTVMLMMSWIGCGSPDDRLVELARESAARQAEQNRQMSQLQHQVAEGSRQLVEADALARQELTRLQRDLQGHQAEVGHQRDALEIERREIAAQRRWESLLGPALVAAATLVACLVPLLICLRVVRGLGAADTGEEALAEFLVQELVAERPVILPTASPQPARLGNDTSADSPQESEAGPP